MASINQESILSGVIPNVLIDGITLQNHRTGSILVSLNLIVEEKLSDDLISSWFSEINIKKYIKIKVFQSLDEKITALLNLSQNFIDIVNSDKKLDSRDPRVKLARNCFRNRSHRRS